VPGSVSACPEGIPLSIASKSLRLPPGNHFFTFKNEVNKILIINILFKERNLDASATPA
jgi:hypothetical protein